jgi:hypothetical protein
VKSYALFMTLLAIPWGTIPAVAMAPHVLHTEGYESPVHAEPDEILVICGSGFTISDHVVYEAMGSGDTTRRHPAAIPAKSGPLSGIAPIVAVGDPAYSLSARLPEVIQVQRIYRLWVVNAAGEWSEPITVNDPRPLWITPGVVNETADPGRVGRQVRVVGRNLRAEPGQRVQMRLKGSTTYVLTSGLTSNSAGDDSPHLGDYVVEAALPARLPAGSYTVSVSRDGRSWVDVPFQKLAVKPDPAELPDFALDEPRFGNCRPGDGMADNPCFAKAIAAAQAQGGGNIVIPPGVWDLSAANGFVLPPHVHLRGSKDRAGKIVRHDTRAAQPRGLFTVTGDNSITDVTFTDADTFASPAESRPIIQLGEARASSDAVTDIIISNNDFQRVGRAIEDSGRPLLRLMVTRNRFAAYDRDLQLPGNHFGAAGPYRIDDSIVRWNTFIPGSFIDIAGHQGVIASELGASQRLDFSNNIADGAATGGLQNPEDPKGWRAAFFWNLNGNQEQLLVSANRISCSGDKAGDGEALSFDGNGDTFGFIGAQPVTRAGDVTVTVHGILLDEQGKHPIERASFYRGHWVQVMEGPGTGQVRKIQSYVEDAAAGTVTFTVAPAWDVLPGPGSRVVVGRDYWQVYAVANDVDQRNPPCQKSNLNDPAGGIIAFWTPTADSLMAGNRQYDTSGLLFNAGYGVPSKAPNCRDCGNGAAFQVGLEIRDNLVDGEYDWASACSQSGIVGALGVAPAPESPPPLVGIGISIAHNRIIHADGLYGGAIDLTATWYLGPPPGHWQLLQSVVIQHNSLEDIDGPLPRRACRYDQKFRAGVRLDGVDNIRNTVLYANRCERVATPLIDGGKDTKRLCTASTAGSCECAASAH